MGDDLPAREEMLAALAGQRRAFLSFLERRVGHREVAEDVLQEAFARSLDKLPLESEESAVAWFYRVLRNAVIDHYRRSGSSERALAALSEKLDREVPVALDERDAVCRCVSRLSETMKPEYALALRRIDVDGVPVQEFAAEAGITPNNARVRVFRARETLRKRVVRWCGSCAERGCVDCTCGEPGSAGCSHAPA
ncbi:MAG TPA: sigma-70 family RNA polymerase sigma factor [Myxococcales bacterium]|nr:sigma-70 family RNA polymerase sigma factor [Myxococcales bacterium]